jgi:hypothetical protein
MFLRNYLLEQTMLTEKTTIKMFKEYSFGTIMLRLNIFPYDIMYAPSIHVFMRSGHCIFELLFR